MRRTIERGVALVVAAAVAFLACGGGSSTSASDPPCVGVPDATCAATYAPPTYATLFANIFQPNCAVGTGTCHTSDFAAGGIVFANAETAYATLLGQGGGTAYVLPHDPSCSTLMKRLESTDPSYHMPRGPNSLSAGDLCTITQWIDEGAMQ